MKTIKLKFPNALLILFALFISASACAQPPGGQQRGQQGPPPIPNDKQIEKMVNKLAKELSLTERQEEQVSELYFAHFEAVKETMEKNKGERGANREVMEKLNTEFEKEVKALLTEEQQKQFDAFQKKNQPQRGRGQRPPRG